MGAEASLYRVKGAETFGEETIVEKVRLPKRYRSKELDERMSVERIRMESKLMSEARSFGVAVPVIFDIDVAGRRIVMEFIEGKMAKDLINSDYRTKNALCRKIGFNIGILHKNGVIHGDLTTSNMILSEGRLYFIDFSLGFKSDEVEHKGVDLHLLNEAFKSSHPTEDGLFKTALRGYREAYPDAEKVIKKMSEIEKRGRYT